MTPTQPLLRLEGVTRTFGAFTAVNNVTEDFSSDEINCIIGPNGAGKSTLLNMICGTLPVTSGRIKLGETPIQGLSGDRIAKLGIARKFQVPSIFSSLTVAENLSVAAALRGDKKLINEILARIRMEDEAHRLAAGLSHGKKQWLEIGMALALRPKILLLDEPTAGLSADETRATGSFLKELKGDVTVVVIEHDMAFVRDLNARTIVLHLGEIIASGAFAEIESNELVKDVYLGRK